MLLNNNEQRVLQMFADDYHKRIYGRDLAKKLKMNQKTVSNILNSLEKEDILKFSIEGKNKYYYLNQFNQHIKELIKLIEISRKINFLKKFKKNKDLFLKLESRTKGILIIFGSYAKGTNNESSDLDVFLIGDIGSVDDLEDIYKIKINIVKSTKEKFNKNEHIIKEIIENHIILKGVEEFVELAW